MPNDSIVVLIRTPHQALRGGGGNFGVVTEFEFWPSAIASSIPVARLMFNVQHTMELLQAYSAFTESRSAGVDGVSAYLFLTKACNHVIICDVTPLDPADGPVNLDAFRQLIAPFFALDPIVSIECMTLPELNSMSDEGNSAGRLYAWSRSTFVPRLTPQVIDALITARSALPVHAASVEIMHLGGAIALKLPSDSAFVHRYTIARTSKVCVRTY